MLVRTWGIQRDVTERVRLEASRRQAEEALRQSDARFRVALNGSPIMVANQDRSLRYTWLYNPQHGWIEQKFLGKTDEEIFNNDESAAITALKRRVLENHESIREEIELTAQGKHYHFDMTVEPLRDSVGAVVGVNSACMDITHLREVMEELQIAKER